MRPFRSLLAAVLIGFVLFPGCSCEDVPPAGPPCKTTADCEGELVCINGYCQESTRRDGGGNEDDGGGIDWPDSGFLDGGAVISDPRNPQKDTDCDGLSDAEEFSAFYGPDKRKTDPNNPDSDGDGILDGIEVGKTTSVESRCTGFEGDGDPGSVTSPVGDDSDRDGLKDGQEDINHNGKQDPGETDPLLPDSDGDGLSDSAEDTNGNHVVDSGETDPVNVDTDGDGLSDGLERNVTHTDPTRSDTDGDTCADGLEDRNRNGIVDSGESDPRTAGDCVGAGLDTDHDGITDDRELTVTHTDPMSADTDHDGLQDGDEDRNTDGDVDPGETNPSSADTDCDGLSDFDELRAYRTDPLQADSDHDGVVDGIEAGATTNPEPSRCTSFVADGDPSTRSNPLLLDTDCDGLADGTEDADRDGRQDSGETNPARRDTDADGLTDGVERGVSANPDSAHCPAFVADGDSSTTTSATSADTDGDGLSDGEEDADRDGRKDSTETDPSHSDSDCDGIGDGRERPFFRSDPLDADTDGDGIVDGVEVGSAASPDSTCSFTPDAEPASHTLAYSPDSDGDGIPDGIEDRNHNGKKDSGETDATNRDTDSDGLIDGIEDANHNGSYNSPAETNALAADTDSDGIPDGTEDFNHDGVRGSGETDPRRADTDGDSCSDAVEDRNWNHMVEPGETNPLVSGDCPPPTATDSDCDGLANTTETNVTLTDPHDADSDNDGLSDGLEAGAVFNPNPAACPGFVADADSSSQTDPRHVDTDCDGLRDNVEDANRNGRVDSGETDPSNPDTDGDGLTDGVEKGVTANADPTFCGNFQGDEGAGTTTNPLDPDSDNDGIADGAEDINGNGRVDTGELNPNNGNDATGPVLQACATPRTINSLHAFDSDVQIAAAAGFTERTTLINAGKEVGVMLYDPTKKIAGFALYQTPAKASASAQEADGRSKLAALGLLTSALTQGFTSWDGFDSVKGYYDQDGGVDLKERARKIVQAYFPSATGLLSGSASVSGPFRLEAQFLRRSANRAVVVMALVPQNHGNVDQMLHVDDLANGTALAQFGDAHSPVCEKLAATNYPKVDFLFVMDNSGSMDQWQAEVGNAVSAIGQQLASAPIDWRIATIHSDSDRANLVGPTGNPSLLAANTPTLPYPSWRFTTSLSQFQTDATPCAHSSTGHCTGISPERGFAPINYALQAHFLPAAANDPAKVRTGAKLVIIWLTDSPEQSVYGYCDWPSATTNRCHDLSDTVSANNPYRAPPGGGSWLSYFRNIPGVGRPFVAGIIPPVGVQMPGEEPMLSEYHDVITDLQGIEADVRNQSATAAAIQQIITAAIGQATPTRLAKPPISASIKVALASPSGASCQALKNDIPRSRTHGFDYDGASKSLVFYGDCRPAYNTEIAVSYRYWDDLTPNPDGSTLPCGGSCEAPLVCDPVTDECVCPADCGGTCEANEACNLGTCSCECPPDCGGRCTGNQTCNTNTCGCVCNQNMSCGVGFRFDTTACACVCDTGALGCGSTMQANSQTCSCDCKPNCGGACTGSKVCDTATCSCECDPTITCPAGKRLDPATCSCVCDTSSIVCPENMEPDAATCGCKCKAGCGGTCGTDTGLTCNSSSCSCVCDLSEPCPSGLVRDPTTCGCVCNPDLLDCEPPFFADPIACACVCAPDCSHEGFAGCSGAASCNASSCSCECLLTCGAGTVRNEQSCTCECDVAALGCETLGAAYEADPETCSCVCKSDCGGCAQGEHCDMSRCQCKGGPS